VHKEGEPVERFPSIRTYLYGKKYRKFRGSSFYYDLEKIYKPWISKIENLRDKVIHKHVVKEMKIELIGKLNRDEAGNIDPSLKITIGIQEYEIEDLEIDCKDSLDKLRNLIKKYFDNYSQ